MGVIDLDVSGLIEKSKRYRHELFDMGMTPKRGHIPSAFGLVEIMTALYDRVLKHDPNNPKWEDRDRFIISQGHAAIVQYVGLADHGYFPKEELGKFTTMNGILKQYPDNSIPGIECATGSLGHGLGIAAGFAMNARKKGKDYRSFVVISDGEYWEGSVSESARFIAHHGLNNVVAIMNYNGICILGEVEGFVKQEPLDEKWKSDGWFVQRINGHSYNEILRAFDRIEQKNKNPNHKDHNKPSVIIADTTKGKGIKEIESKHLWHNTFPDEEQKARFKEQLNENHIVH